MVGAFAIPAALDAAEAASAEIEIGNLLQEIAAAGHDTALLLEGELKSLYQLFTSEPIAALKAANDVGDAGAAAAAQAEIQAPSIGEQAVAALQADQALATAPPGAVAPETIGLVPSGTGPNGEPTYSFPALPGAASGEVGTPVAPGGVGGVVSNPAPSPTPAPAEQGIVDAVNGAISGLSSSISDALSGIGTSVANGISQGINGVLGGIGTTFQGVFQGLGNIAPTIEAAFNGLGASLSVNFDALIQAVDTIAPAITGLEPLAGSLVDSIAQRLAHWYTAFPLSEAQTAAAGARKGIHDFLFGGGSGPPILPSAPSTGDMKAASPCNVFEAYLSSLLASTQNPQGFLGWIVALIGNLAIGPVILEKSLVPVFSSLEDCSWYNNPTRRPDAATTIDSLFKGVIDQQQADLDLQKDGYNGDRINELTGQAYSFPAYEVAADWLMRGFITQDDFDKIRLANRQKPEYEQAFLQGIMRAVDPSGAILNSGLDSALANGFLAGSFGSTPPQPYKDLYTKALIDPAQADYDWKRHWFVPPVDWFIAGYRRGVFTKDDVYNAATLHNIPAELVDKLLTIAEPLVPLRLLATLYGGEQIDETGLKAQFAERGYSDADTALLINYIKLTKPVKATTPPEDLEKLSIAAADELLFSNVIDGPFYQGILEAHGFSSDAAALQLQYVELKHDAQKRKEQAREIVNEVSMGTLSEADAQSQLYALGYAPGEVLIHSKAMRQAKNSKLKVPTFAQAEKMLENGIIDDAGFNAYLVSQNYDPNWIPQIMALVALGKTTPGASA